MDVMGQMEAMRDAMELAEKVGDYKTAYNAGDNLEAIVLTGNTLIKHLATKGMRDTIEVAHMRDLCDAAGKAIESLTYMLYDGISAALLLDFNKDFDVVAEETAERINDLLVEYGLW